MTEQGWEDELAAVWDRLGRTDDESFRAEIEAVARRAPDGSGGTADFERAAAFDSTGSSDLAVPLYRAALRDGLVGERRRRAVIQLASSLRNVGEVDEAVALLRAELERPSDGLDDAVRGFLALALADAGHEREGLRHALEALAPHLPRYQRSLAAYARLLVEPEPPVRAPPGRSRQNAPVDAIEEWSRAQERVIALMEGATAEQVQTRVPACPDWTVRDLFSHMVGLGSDVVAGDEPDDHNEDWTAKQVAERRGHSVDDLVKEWQETAEPLRTWMRAHGPRPLGDVIIHEQDLRGALGVPGGKDSDGVAAIRDRFTARVGQRLPGGTTLGLVGTHWSWASDGGDPEQADVVLHADEFDLHRATLARRSADQLRSWTTKGDVEPVLDAFATLGALPTGDRSE